MQRPHRGRRPSPPPFQTQHQGKGVGLRTSKEVPVPVSFGSGVVGDVNALQTLDTKDPFTAMSLLRKLLNKTARVGDKMASEEHKLSLRLLSIIEPFISLHPVDESQIVSLTRQPNEILDMIAFHIDSRKDLLSLALTCQRLRDVVLPRHLEYRFIQCKPSAEKLWKHLIAHPLLARNVRCLHIINDMSKEMEIVPSRVAAKTLDDVDARGRQALDGHVVHQRLIIEALTHMTALTTFHWSCNSSLITFDDVSPTLFTCEMLKEVEITDNQIFSAHSVKGLDEEGAAEESDQMILSGRATRNKLVSRSQIFNVPDLTSVAVRTAKGTSRLSKHPSLENIQSLLISHCPNLTTLKIGYNHRRPFIPRADDFFALGRWPNLQTLSLQNLWCSTQNGFEAATNFLAAHQSLVSLHFELGRIQLDLPRNALPKLRELTCSRDVAVFILSCPRDDGLYVRPLECIKGIKLSGGRDRDEALLKNIVKYATTLRKIELACYNEIDDIRKLAEAAPKLTWLEVGKKSSSLTKSNNSAAPASVNEWANVLSSLPELTALHGVNFFYEFSDALSHSDRSRIKKNDEVASMLAWKCPKLKKVDYYSDASNSGKIVILGSKEGDANGSRWEVKRLKQSSKDSLFH